MSTWKAGAGIRVEDGRVVEGEALRSAAALPRGRCVVCNARTHNIYDHLCDEHAAPMPPKVAPAPSSPALAPATLSGERLVDRDHLATVASRFMLNAEMMDRAAAAGERFGRADLELVATNYRHAATHITALLAALAAETARCTELHALQLQAAQREAALRGALEGAVMDVTPKFVEELRISAEVARSLGYASLAIDLVTAARYLGDLLTAARALAREEG